MNVSERSKSKLLVTLGGNIGNQLFQLAGALTLVNGDFSRLLFDERLTYLCNGPQLNKVLASVTLLTASRRDLICYGLWPFNCYRNARIHHGFQALAQMTGHIVTYHSDPSPKQISAKEFTSEVSGRAQIVGYFQHMDWVKEGSTFLLPNLTTHQVDLRLRALGVSIRRRDDYVGNRLPLRYYAECFLKFVDRQVPFDDMLITGDTVEQLGFKAFSEVQRHHLGDNTWDEQFVLLSSCAYSVLSNSTFAWWAAWIAHNRRQVRTNTSPHTFYPSGWFDSSLTNLEGWSSVEKGELW